MENKSAFKYYVIVAVAAIIIGILLGVIIIRDNANGDKITSLQKTVDESKGVIKDLRKTNALITDSLNAVKKLKANSDVEIKKKNAKIGLLSQKLATLSESDTEVSPNAKYDTLVYVVGADTLVKPYAFSGRQVDRLYDNTKELFIRRDMVDTYEELTDTYDYNLHMAAEELKFATDQYKTCVSINDEFDKMVKAQGDEIKILQKQKKHRGFFEAVLGGVVAILAGVFIAK